jgi:hypothetical protein
MHVVVPFSGVCWQSVFLFCCFVVLGSFTLGVQPVNQSPSTSQPVSQSVSDLLHPFAGIDSHDCDLSLGAVIRVQLIVDVASIYKHVFVLSVAYLSETVGVTCGIQV